MVVVVPTELERGLAERLVAMLDAAPDRATHGSRDAEVGIVAGALAHHRERCVSLAGALVASLETDARFTVDQLDALLERVDETVEPREVRAVVESHRNLLTMIASARALLPKALAGSARERGVQDA